MGFVHSRLSVIKKKQKKKHMDRITYLRTELSAEATVAGDRSKTRGVLNRRSRKRQCGLNGGPVVTSFFRLAIP